MSKTQPLARTVVTEFNTYVADKNTRTRMLRGKYSAKIDQNDPFSSGDDTAMPIAKSIGPVNKTVIIQSFEPLNLRLINGSSHIDVVCNDLFIFNGSIDRIEVSAANPTRFTFMYS